MALYGVAQHSARTSGNQRAKLCMTTAAMSVLPSPVGRHTSVLASSAVCRGSGGARRSGGRQALVQAGCVQPCPQQGCA